MLEKFFPHWASISWLYIFPDSFYLVSLWTLQPGRTEVLLFISQYLFPQRSYERDTQTDRHRETERENLDVLNEEWGQIPVSFQSKLSVFSFIGLDSRIIKKVTLSELTSFLKDKQQWTVSFSHRMDRRSFIACASRYPKPPPKQSGASQRSSTSG